MGESNRSDDRAALDRLTARIGDRRLEARFLAGRAERDLRQIRFAMLLGGFLNLGFAVLDSLVITENLAPALTIRIVWAVPVTAIGYAASHLAYFEARLDALVWIVMLTATLLFAALNAVSNTPDVYLSGFVIVLFFLQLLLPMSFPTTLAVGVSCTMVFAVIITLIREIPIGHLLTIYSQFLATLVAGTFAVYLINGFRRLEFLAGERVGQQRKQYFDLLTRILPSSIVARMEGGEAEIADDVPDAAVLFADIVAFTETAARHPPGVVIAALNALFKRFDELVSRHDLEKIKTIGDAYMVAGGVPEPRRSHTHAIAELALDMLQAAAAPPGPDDEPLRVRIGIHAGPLIAGVIGESRFGYDLWGDTVNLASRMQSHAEPDRTQVSEAVCRELADAFELEPRGPIEVKGKGEVNAWYLTGRKH